MSGIEVRHDYPRTGTATVVEDGETVARFYGGDMAGNDAEVFAAIMRGDLIAVRWGDGAPVRVPRSERRTS